MSNVSPRSVFVWVAACLWLSPSIYCNIWPHARAGEIGETAFQGLLVILMAIIPIMARHTAPAVKAGLYTVGMCLLAWSLYNAIHMGYEAQETTTKGPRATLARAEAYRAQIAILEAEKGRITSKPGYERTGESAVAAAESSLRMAVEVATAECKTGEGVKCASRKGEVEALRKDAGKIAAARDVTKHVEEIEGDIRRERGKLADLGPLPESRDYVTALISRTNEELVLAIILIARAVGVEGAAFFGPGATLTYFSPTLPRTLPKTGETAVMSPGRPLPLQRKPSRKKGEAGDKAGRVREWLKSRTVNTPGHLLPCKGEAYADYERWCRSSGVATLELPSFGKIMKELGIGKVKRSGYLYYVGIALKRQPALQVVSG